MRCLIAGAVLLLGGLPARGEDAEGGKDHPLFKRMPGFEIHAYTQTDFDARDFALDPDGEKTQRVEGRTTAIDYSVPGDAHPSVLQVLRNHANAIKAIGGQTLMQGEYAATFKLVKKDKEVWTSLEVSNGGGYYTLTIVERGAMKQEISSSDMLQALEKDGRVALYINFDTGKSAIKPESRPIVAEITKLLEENPDLTLRVEGHTDDVGDAVSNRTLSLTRAQAVVAALTAAKIDASRLEAKGFGMTKPLADNKTDEGRAKNRRVELVKR